ncbi:LuxR family transcriptional regulator (plasmid) [Ensifer adhaerens]|uniref:LuxR family transcriptional regulator n=1 Tax=Ensifer adhaerens TaxID=106592 RepID=UPI002E2D2E15|nr:LuxR family transcriptional regulator [Ensifer adhaerens]UAX98441.1 LuxR family transcriptional regulator [Ensifer adhaerens]UAY05821.1 LuxR family transcriptional regulator [Ensifer adhaerens]UAY13198.1 LuxR family transcriptional regulator [Ensifer adhaerens]
MVNHRRLSLSLRTLRSAQRREDLYPALGELCLQYGLDHMTFLVVSSGDGLGPYPYYCTTYPDAWTAVYIDSGYFDIDPVIDVVRWGFLPVDWSSLDQASGSASRLFKNARAHGIGSQGLTMPIRGPHGERCLFSVTSKLPRREWSRIRDSSIHELQILSHHVHETVFHAIGLRERDRIRRLSRRERQCLQLLAMGRISKQIAADLGISESSVRLYLRSARFKLGAVTSHHAVAKASFLELITV